MQKFQRELNVQNRILSSAIFIFSEMSLEITLIMHNGHLS